MITVNLHRPSRVHAETISGEHRTFDVLTVTCEDRGEVNILLPAGTAARVADALKEAIEPPALGQLEAI